MAKKKYSLKPRKKKSKSEKNFEELLQLIFSGAIAGSILSVIFSMTTSTGMKFLVLLSFIMIGVLIAVGFWRLMDSWI